MTGARSENRAREAAPGYGRVVYVDKEGVSWVRVPGRSVSSGVEESESSQSSSKSSWSSAASVQLVSVAHVGGLSSDQFHVCQRSTTGKVFGKGR
jgi:hypothetical protein